MGNAVRLFFLSALNHWRYVLWPCLFQAEFDVTYLNKLYVERSEVLSNDDALIQTALAAGALRLMSDDDDLLCLDPLGDLRILLPRRALDEQVAGQ